MTPAALNAETRALVLMARAGFEIEPESALLKQRVIAYIDAGGFAMLLACKHCEIKYPLASEDRTIVSRVATLSCLGCGRTGTLREDKRARAWREIHKREAQHEAMKREGRDDS